MQFHSGEYFEIFKESTFFRKPIKIIISIEIEKSQ